MGSADTTSPIEINLSVEVSRWSSYKVLALVCVKCIAREMLLCAMILHHGRRGPFKKCFFKALFSPLEPGCYYYFQLHCHTNFILKPISDDSKVFLSTEFHVGRFLQKSQVGSFGIVSILRIMSAPRLEGSSSKYVLPWIVTGGNFFLGNTAGPFHKTCFWLWHLHGVYTLKLLITIFLSIWK